METRRLCQPYGVALGPGGRVYVTDKGKHRVACMDEEGAFAFAFGEKGSGAGQLHDPRGIAVHAMQVSGGGERRGGHSCACDAGERRAVAMHAIQVRGGAAIAVHAM